MRNKIYIAFDLETTGFDPAVDSIIEVGAVKFSGDNILATFSSLVNYQGKLSVGVQNLTGINEEELVKARLWSEVSLDLRDFLSGVDNIVGHNIDFDLSFLKANGIDLSKYKKWDTWYLFGMLMPGRESYSLEVLYRALVGNFRAHRALNDARATANLLMIGQQKIRELSSPTLGRIVEVVGRGRWVYGDLFVEEKQRREHDQIEVVKKIIESNCFSRSNLGVDQAQPSGDQLVLREITLSDFISDWSAYNYQVLAVSDRVLQRLKNTVSADFFIDSRQEYLCRQSLRRKLAQIGLKTEDIGIIVKLLLRIEAGFWDGYLRDLKFDEKEMIGLADYRCCRSETGLFCFYDYKLQAIIKDNRKVITRVKSLAPLAGKNMRGLAVWLEDMLFEDGLTYQTQVAVDWNKIESMLAQWGKCTLNNEQTKSEGEAKISELTKDWEVLWPQLDWLIRSRGVQDNYGIKLSFTPSVYQGLEYQKIQEWVVKIEAKMRELLLVDKSDLVGVQIKTDLQKVLWGVAGKNNWVAQGVINEAHDNLRLTVDLVNWQETVAEWKQDFGYICLMSRSFLSDGYYYALDLLTKNPGQTKFISRLNQPVNMIRNYGFSWEVMGEKLDWSKKNVFLFSSKIKAKKAYDKFSELFAGDETKKILDREAAYKNSDWLAGVLICSINDLTAISLKTSQFDSIFLESLPFDPPGSLLIGYRSLMYGDTYFDRYYVERMLAKLKFVVSLLSKSGNFYLADARLDNRSYGEKILKLLKVRTR
ncbi:MAG: 3'-5' exonuclease [Patescibacteria group bacterium]